MSKKPDYDQLYDIAENQGGYFTASQAIGEALAQGLVTKKALRLREKKRGGRFREIFQKYLKRESRK